MGGIASQITSFTIVYSTVYSDADHRKHQSSASLPGTGEFPAHMASNAENVSIWWRQWILTVSFMTNPQYRQLTQNVSHTFWYLPITKRGNNLSSRHNIPSCYLLNDESDSSINNKHDNINLAIALTTLYQLLLLSAYDSPLGDKHICACYGGHYVEAISIG